MGQPRGSYPCGKNCLTCKYLSDGQTLYTFHATGETRPITNHIDCNSKNVIYMIQCNHCSKQYIGETKRRLKDRFNEHRRPADNQNTFLPMITVKKLKKNHVTCKTIETSVFNENGDSLPGPVNYRDFRETGPRADNRVLSSLSQL